jgi:hypothetical protein
MKIDTDNIIIAARKIAEIISKGFPEIPDDLAREATAKMLLNLHYEAVISYDLYTDQHAAMDAEIEARRLAKLQGDDLC